MAKRKKQRGGARLPVMKYYDQDASPRGKYLLGNYVPVPDQRVRVMLRGGSYIDIEPVRGGVVVRAMGNAAEDMAIMPDCGNVAQIRLIKAIKR
jgi:hypothetical protein